MDDFDATLRNLTPAEGHFLAGVFTVRAKFYVGAVPRGSTVRYTPSLSVETTWPYDVPLLPLLFGPAAERAYYGRPVYRYVLQDCAKITALLSALPPLPARVQAQADALRVFCQAEGAQERAAAFAAFRVVSQAAL